ncbi:Hypothetical predicted protein [Marmota monax]|uniref:Uncharacterized protein n=1 Tax=Marmota monax TaxID=9995 RepID=A0A5E4ANJ6_MARMO|nr:Hypothetical predicted protein [Marmota monax]
MEDQQISQSGQSPSQPSTSETHLEVVVDDEIPGPSALWVKPCLPCRSSRKREWTSESEEDSEDDSPGIFDSAPWVESGLLPETTGLKRKRESSTESEDELEDLEKDPVVKRFLAWDKNLRVSDKSQQNVPSPGSFVACHISLQDLAVSCREDSYLANDMEEDNQAPKQDIFHFLYGKSYAQRPLFHKLRYQFICSMGWNTWVSKEECEEIQAYDPELWVWGRDRTLIP